jgi:hypothetical protein
MPSGQIQFISLSYHMIMQYVSGMISSGPDDQLKKPRNNPGPALLFLDITTCGCYLARTIILVSAQFPEFI